MPARKTKVKRTGRRVLNRSSRARAIPTITFSPQKIVTYGILLVILMLCIWTIKTPSSHWDSSKKLSVVYPQENGDVVVAVFDPRLNEITQIIIPSTTETATARQLGTWRVKSLWQLGINENLDGKLLAETITNHLRMPAVAWADSRFEGFVSGSTSEALKSFFTVTQTNLSLKDKLSLLLFTAQVHNTGYSMINLSESTYLRETTLQDGTEGFTTFAKLPQDIAAVFSANSFVGREVTVALYDLSNSATVAVEIGKVIEVLGAKVALVSNSGDDSDIDCIVKGKDVEIVTVVKDIFACDLEIAESSSSFDIEMTIGEKFERRF